MNRWIAALCVSLCAPLLGVTSAQAQVVYRCGSQYSQVPCPEGRVVDATDPRSAAQRAESKRVAAAERKLGADMERERLAQQAAQPQGAAGFNVRPATPDAAASANERHAGKKSKKGKSKAGTHDSSERGDFVAVDPTSLKKTAKK